MFLFWDTTAETGLKKGKKETEILSLKEIKSDLARILPASVKEKCDGYKKIDSLIIQKEKELGIK